MGKFELIKMYVNEEWPMLFFMFLCACGIYREAGIITAVWAYAFSVLLFANSELTKLLADWVKEQSHE